MKRVLVLVLTLVGMTLAQARVGAAQGFEGLWGNDAEPGWGLSLFQRDDRLFAVWFVYDESGRPTWFVQPGGSWTYWPNGAHFDGPIYHPKATPFYAYDAAKFSPGLPQGQGGVDFRSLVEATTYFYAPGRRWNYAFLQPIRREGFGQGWSAPVTGVGDLWWGGPSQRGWGVAIHQQAATLFIVWFTYGDDGEPTWYVMPEGLWTTTGSYAGAVYRTSRASPGAGQSGATTFRIAAVGHFELTFESVQRARLDVTVGYDRVILDLVRQPF